MLRVFSSSAMTPEMRGSGVGFCPNKVVAPAKRVISSARDPRMRDDAGSEGRKDSDI